MEYQFSLNVLISRLTHSSQSFCLSASVRVGYLLCFAQSSGKVGLLSLSQDILLIVELILFKSSSVKFRDIISLVFSTSLNKFNVDIIVSSKSLEFSILSKQLYFFKNSKVSKSSFKLFLYLCNADFVLTNRKI